MSTIRSDLPNLPPATSTGQTAQMRTAQAAFFRAAMGDVQSAPAPSQVRAGETPRTPEAARAPRPGQLLDIRV